MIAQLVVPTAKGEKVIRPLSIHSSGQVNHLRIVLDTEEETFDRWMFYFMRDLGGYIETTDAKSIQDALNLTRSEEGVREVDELK